tara:strand:+ start:168 stop:1007 length:840 start_codon:yes stop_codon:yes gene_type:complete
MATPKWLKDVMKQSSTAAGRAKSRANAPTKEEMKQANEMAKTWLTNIGLTMIPVGLVGTQAGQALAKVYGKAISSGIINRIRSRTPAEKEELYSLYRGVPKFNFGDVKQALKEGNVHTGNYFTQYLDYAIKYGKVGAKHGHGATAKEVAANYKNPFFIKEVKLNKKQLIESYFAQSRGGRTPGEEVKWLISKGHKKKDAVKSVKFDLDLFKRDIDAFIKSYKKGGRLDEYATDPVFTVKPNLRRTATTIKNRKSGTDSHIKDLTAAQKFKDKIKKYFKS